MKRGLLTALLLASAQAPLASTLVAVALPAIAHDLGSDTVHATTLLVSSYLVITILLQGPGGRLSDALGHGRMFWAGIWLFVLGSLMGLASPGLWLLALARAVMAAGGALLVPSTMALLRALVEPERRGRVFGLFGAVLALSASLGPVVGGAVVEGLGWRATFLVSIPFLLVAAVLLRLDPLPAVEARHGKGIGAVLRRIDLSGLVLLFAALVLVSLSAREDGVVRAAVLLAGLAAGAGFVVREWHSAQPVLDVRLLRDPVMAGAIAITGLQSFAMYGLLFQLPVFFKHFRGTSAHDMGLSLFTMMIGMVVAAPLGGRAMDWLGARRTGLIGAALLLAGSLALCRLASFATPAEAMPSLVLFGVGLGLSSAPAQSSTMAAVAADHAGEAAGLSWTLRYFGGMASIVVQAMVLGDEQAMTQTHHVAMIGLYAVAALLSLAACLLLPGPRPRKA